MLQTIPKPSLALLLAAMTAGLAADIAWEFWARLLTPLWAGGPLQPAALVQQVFGGISYGMAEAIHAVVGILFYPLGYLFIARPIADWATPFLPWWGVGLGFGVGLWIFALYVMAHLVAGNPPFLGWIRLTWASLGGHMLFGLIVATVIRRFESVNS